MKSTLKKILFGALLGALIAFPVGMNAGRGDPLLSNPFAKSNLTNKVKSGAEDIIENTKGAIHDATKPEPRDGNRR